MTGNQAPPRPPCLPVRCLRAFVRTIASSRLHDVIHVAWVMAKILLVTLFLVWAVGIPSALLPDRWKSVTAPFEIAFQRITWNPLRGILLHRVSVTDPDWQAKPLLAADELLIRPHYRAWLKGDWKFSRCDVAGGTIRLPLHEGADDLIVRDIEGSYIMLPLLTQLSLRARSDVDAQISVTGVIHEQADAPDKAPVDVLGVVRSIRQSLSNTPVWITTLRARMRDANFDTPPQVSVVFQIDPRDKARTKTDMVIETGSLVYREQQYDGVRCEALLSADRIAIPRFRVVQGERTFTLAGAYRRGEDIFDAHAVNQLPPPAVLPLIPAPWLEHLDEWGISFSGNLQAEAWIGPCRLKDVPRHWGGWASIEDARINEVPVHKAFASFKRTPDRLAIEDGVVDGGSGAGRGKGSFAVITDFSNRVVHLDIDAAIELRQFGAILPRGLRGVADMFEITDAPVAFRGTVDIPIDDANRTVSSGFIAGTNVIFRGVPVTGVNTWMIYSNDTVYLEDFRVTCATGGVTGRLELDLRREQYGINLDITTNPKTIAPMAGASFARHFKPYRFTDQILVQARGVVDVKNDRDTDLDIFISGQSIGAGPLLCDRLLVQAHRGPGLLTVSNIQATIFQGSATGRLVVTMKPGKRDKFELSINARDLLMDRVVSHFRGSSSQTYEGMIDLAIDLRGHHPDQPGWTNLTGTGAMEVKDGKLLRIPLFGGLSTLLSKIYPGFGFSEQNRMTATLEFKDGAVYSRDVKLAGNMLSLSAHGYFRYSNYLNFYVQVHPFRDGTLASALRLVTFPISYLLEFKVTGPVQDPVWRPSNLPL